MSAASSAITKSTPNAQPTRLRVVYQTAPAPWHASRPAHEQPALPLVWDLPTGLPAEPPEPRHLVVVGSPGELASAPHPGAWVARIAPAILEVVAGERPATQLSRWTSRDVYATLARRAAVALRHPAGKGRPAQCRRIKSVRLCSPDSGIVEASAVVTGIERTRAVALRLELINRTGPHPQRWLITACELG
ncbi:MAG: Rv3235 family protein [Actinomycetes bacterium]|jgi:hypothetical protein|nr:Rv3235 family protein [Candidatus Nanopelagicales bacterium]